MATSGAYFVSTELVSQYVDLRRFINNEPTSLTAITVPESVSISVSGSWLAIVVKRKYQGKYRSILG